MDCVDGYDEIACKCPDYFILIVFFCIFLQKNEVLFGFLFMEYSQYIDDFMLLITYNVWYGECQWYMFQMLYYYFINHCSYQVGQLTEKKKKIFIWLKQ